MRFYFSVTSKEKVSHHQELIPTTIFDSPVAGCVALAREIADLISGGRKSPVVLGLATGSTPTGVYRELIRLHKEEGLSFADVKTFNLDEYYGLEPTHPESYMAFMRDQLFDHVDIPPESAFVPDGTVPENEIVDYCQSYEDRIQATGGIDLQVLGIGRTGHIGFNEPGSGRDSRTRLVQLDALTRLDAADAFLGEENVPRSAITMGVGTILDARRTVLLAWGTAKARVLARMVEGKVTEALPASFLQEHRDSRVFVDEAAAKNLARRRQL